MSWLYTAPLGLVVIFVVLLVLGALDVGHRLSRVAPVAEQQVSTVSAAILAIVGLLLAFSFGMAGDRHALRRAAAVDEVNSIGTFWLRTSLLTEPVRSEIRSRLRRYTDLHIEHREAGTDVTRMAALEAEATRLQDELWSLFDEEAHRAPETNMVLLVAPALNAMIDDAAVVLAAKENRVPDAVIFYMIILIVVAGIVIGYRPRDEKRNLILWGLFLVVLGGTLLILLDLDRPRRGLIQTDTAVYVRLRDSMRGH